MLVDLSCEIFVVFHIARTRALMRNSTSVARKFALAKHDFLICLQTILIIIKQNSDAFQKRMETLLFFRVQYYYYQHFSPFMQCPAHQQFVWLKDEVLNRTRMKAHNSIICLIKLMTFHEIISLAMYSSFDIHELGRDSIFNHDPNLIQLDWTRDDSNNFLSFIFIFIFICSSPYCSYEKSKHLVSFYNWHPSFTHHHCQHSNEPDKMDVFQSTSMRFSTHHKLKNSPPIDDDPPFLSNVMDLNDGIHFCDSRLNFLCWGNIHNLS